MLTDSPVVRTFGPRLLFLTGAIGTVAILQWMHHLRVTGQLPGVTLIFYALFAFEDYGATVCELLILGAAVFVASRMPARTVLRGVGEHPLTVAALSAVVLCVGALFVYRNHPLSMDEYAAYFQSRVFAAGHLTGRFPLPQMDWLIPPGFQSFFLSVSLASGQVTESYWPGYALILTPFTALGIPWACNPVLSALTALVIYRLAMHLFADVEAAGLAMLLTIASPVFFGIGISYYSMQAHLLANSLYALLLIRPSSRRALAAGIVGSVALCLHNPVPHMLFALPWLIWILTRPQGLRLFAWMCLGYLPLCLLLGVGWFELLHELRSATAVTDPAAAAGGLDFFKSMLSIFAAPNGTVLLTRLIGVAKIWVWAVPGLILLACYGAYRWRDNALCRALAAAAVMTLVGYLFFPVDQGHGWGNRYFHSAWMTLPLLATAALYRPVIGFGATPSEAGVRSAGAFEDDGTRAYVVTCIILTLIFGVGFRAWQMQQFIADDVAQLPEYHGTEPRIVIVDTNLSFYGADLVQNDPWLRGDEIRMISHGYLEDEKMIAKSYPTWHKVYGDRYGTVWSAAK